MHVNSADFFVQKYMCKEAYYDIILTITVI